MCDVTMDFIAECDRQLLEHVKKHSLISDLMRGESPMTVLPIDAKERKAIPLTTGCLDYFPNALAEVAKISKAGNDQHNPGQPLHWSRGKSSDHADTITRHLLERGKIDTDGKRHSAKMAWRALALLQEELEAAGAPMARGAYFDEPVPTPLTSTGQVSSLIVEELRRTE